MSTTVIRKTHPLVLVAAGALTIFSLLGSAAITGLIPSAYSEKQDVGQSLQDGTGAAIAKRQATEKSATLKTQEKEIMKPNRELTADKSKACLNCGKIVSIRAVEQESQASGLEAVAGGNVDNQLGQSNALMTVPGVNGGAYARHTIETHTAYIIKVRMDNGSYRMITQYSEPKHSVGDMVKLQSGQLTRA
ncbi:MAG: hypothetical protein ABI475_10160 [Methylophilaceae bacterium]